MNAKSGFFPRKMPVQRRAKETVSAVLQAAAHILQTHGYETMTTNLVAARAGVSIGSLYQYFPNKQSLLVALCDLRDEAVLAQYAQRLPRIAMLPLARAIREMVALELAIQRKNPALRQIMLQWIPKFCGPQRLQVVAEQAIKWVESYLQLHRSKLWPKDLHVGSPGTELEFAL